jgi:hypothetical protein
MTCKLVFVNTIIVIFKVLVNEHCLFKMKMQL